MRLSKIKIQNNKIYDRTTQKQSGLIAMAKKGNDRADQDSPWKLILRQYFQEAMEFFFLDIADQIDWTKPIEFLDKEFQQLTPDSEIGKRFADQLVRVYQKGGNSIILLIHLEVQAEPEEIFPERIFTYLLRIFDYFHQPPISLAILCDSDAKWRPNQYGFTTFGSSLQFNFTSVKLLDYAVQRDELESSQNVFATVVMTHLKAQETKSNPMARKQWKLALIKRLYERGYDRSYILNLFKFTDWLLILPEELKFSFWEELRIYEEERQMPYITSVEQIGYDRGVREADQRLQEQLLEAQRSQERLLNAQRSLLVRQLTRKIGPMPSDTIDRINTVPIDQLESLGEALFDFESIVDLTTWLDNQG
ncbi:MAG: DUF4351 domain-containing protein [Alkalinema sp. CAN_BIN05]|nr:DUF4351 domain-containing protein [Alkalinema sp. CAN_BIN05]